MGSAEHPQACTEWHALLSLRTAARWHPACASHSRGGRRQRPPANAENMKDHRILAPQHQAVHAPNAEMQHDIHAVTLPNATSLRVKPNTRDQAQAEPVEKVDSHHAHQLGQHVIINSSADINDSMALPGSSSQRFLAAFMAPACPPLAHNTPQHPPARQGPQHTATSGSNHTCHPT